MYFASGLPMHMVHAWSESRILALVTEYALALQRVTRLKLESALHLNVPGEIPEHYQRPGDVHSLRSSIIENTVRSSLPSASDTLVQPKVYYKVQC